MVYAGKLANWSIGQLVTWSIGGSRGAMQAGCHGRVLTPVEASTAAERCTGVRDTRGTQLTSALAVCRCPFALLPLALPQAGVAALNSELPPQQPRSRLRLRLRRGRPLALAARTSTVAE